MSGHAPVIPPEGRHRYSVRVYYEDTDAGGIVYHANYLRFAERARTEALREMGIPHAELTARFGLMLVVRKVEVDYRRAARLDDSLVVETTALDVGGASLVLRQDIRSPAGSCAVLTIGLACVRPGESGPDNAGPGGNRPGRLPPRWRTALAALRDARQPVANEKGTGSWIGQ